MLVVAEHEQLPVPQARAGEPAAWDILFRRYQLPFYVYVFELVHDEQASLDIVQETFIAAARHIGGLREDGEIRKLAVRHRAPEMHSALAQAGRARPSRWRNSPPHRTNLRTTRTNCSSARTGGSRYEFAEPTAACRNAPCCCCISSRIFRSKKLPRITDTPLGTVKSRLHYAKKALRKLLEEEAMKTLREVILGQHQAAEPKLDAIRERVVADLAHGTSGKATVGGEHVAGDGRRAPGGRITDWRQFVWSLRWHLAGMSAAWVVAVLLSIDRTPGPVQGVEHPPSPSPRAVVGRAAREPTAGPGTDCGARLGNGPVAATR